MRLEEAEQGLTIVAHAKRRILEQANVLDRESAGGVPYHQAPTGARREQPRQPRSSRDGQPRAQELAIDLSQGRGSTGIGVVADFEAVRVKPVKRTCSVVGRSDGRFRLGDKLQRLVVEGVERVGPVLVLNGHERLLRRVGNRQAGSRQHAAPA